MAYSSWSVIAGETPTATKWNLLGSNDADFDSRLNAIAYPRCYPWAFMGTIILNETGQRWHVLGDCTITEWFMRVKTAPTGADLIVDIHKNGTTIWSTQGNRAKIVDGEVTGSGTTFNTTALSKGDYLDLIVDQVGSTVKGADLVVELETSQ
jgi:hypothetical protein